MMQTQDTMPSWFPVFFPVFFVFMWLSITTLLALFSGWFQLRRQFPITGDAPLLKLRMQSGMMGWVNFSGILSFAACQSGLRIGGLAPLRAVLQPFSGAMGPDRGGASHAFPDADGTSRARPAGDPQADY